MNRMIQITPRACRERRIEREVSLIYFFKLPLFKNHCSHWTLFFMIRNNFHFTLVIVLCLSSGPSKRKFFAKANLMGMTTNEFVYVMLSVKGIGFGELFICYATSTVRDIKPSKGEMNNFDLRSIRQRSRKTWVRTCIIGIRQCFVTQSIPNRCSRLRIHSVLGGYREQ